MRVAIHQPEHLPWIGFFDKMLQCDLYVILDSVQFSKNNFQNRNRLLDRQGTIFWSTVPVKMTGHTSKRIADMEIDNCRPWRRKVIARINESYRRHRFFDQFAVEVENILMYDYKMLVDLNISIINFFRNKFNINVPILRSSELLLDGNRSDLLLSICKSVGADMYISGPTGIEYLDTKIFDEAGVKISYHKFIHPIYPAPIFRPYLSSLDLLFNCGPDSREHLGIRA